MISLRDYWMSRDEMYAAELTDEIRDNAAETVSKINAALALAAVDGVFPGIDPHTGSNVSSGWRPSAINERTQNSAKGSKHLTAQACDIRDTTDRALARWALAHEAELRTVGIKGMERPGWTPTWVHWQTVSVRSGTWCFVPSAHPALVAALPDEGPA